MRWSFITLTGSQTNTREKIPTRFYLGPYIWYVIKALAGACLVLRNGTIDGEAVTGWRSITHLDLQLTNVFLGQAELEGGASDGNGDQNNVATPPTVVEKVRQCLHVTFPKLKLY